MPKVVTQDEMQSVLGAIHALSRPCSIEEIANALTPSPPRRTLQRRLAHLVTQNRLRATGRRGGRRYHPGPVFVAGEHLTQLQVDGALPLPSKRPTSFAAAPKKVSTRSGSGASEDLPARKSTVPSPIRAGAPPPVAPNAGAATGEILPPMYFWHLCAISAGGNSQRPPQA